MDKVRICYRNVCKIMLFVIAFWAVFLHPAVSHGQEITEQIFITIKINGTPIFTDTNPYIKQNRTFVPVRFVAESFNMAVEWLPEEKKIVLTDEEHMIEMWIDSNRLIVNGEETLMDVNVEGFSGRAMVPVRYLAEIKGFEVRFDDYTYSVEMNREGFAVHDSNILNRPYTDEDIIWLARITYVEGRNLSLKGKLAIANVVLNRTRNPNFPDTVYDVIFDSRYSKQFPPAHKPGFTELKPDSSSVIAAKMALEGVNNIDKCLYFNNKPFKNKSKDLYTTIDGEYFYY